MKTQPVIRITESGAVECNHTYPIEPVPYGIGDEQYYGSRMDEYYKACKEAEAGFLPVTNEMTAANYLAQYHCLTIAVTDGKPEWKYVTKGIYPYTGEVKIEEKQILITRGSSYKLEGSNEIKPADRWIDGKPYIVKKLITLVEPKPEEESDPPISPKGIKSYEFNLVPKPEVKEPKCDAGCKVFTGGEIKHTKTCVFYEESLSESYDNIRTELDKLQKFKSYVHDRLDKMGVPADPEPDSNKAHGCRIEGRLNYIEEQIKEQQGIIKTYIHANEHNRICGEADAKTISQLREANKELVEALKEAIEEMDESKIKYYQHIITKHSNL